MKVFHGGKILRSSTAYVAKAMYAEGRRPTKYREEIFYLKRNRLKIKNPPSLIRASAGEGGPDGTQKEVI